MYLIKNINKADKNYIRAVQIGPTGVDITYGVDRVAIHFVSYAVALLVARMLWIVKIGNMEIEEEKLEQT
ncbi:hypothetical protein BU202_08115 [Streptococcus cuniculi]|uniref:Uncharacterized protein n=1 Tax=Streptococcus cuniculi TaxID=1432788 RepID=A0A1Q8E667_9STRE|nr:hypothetical protein [Streptococcus cuniculi]OLF47282.1 hypothetical protein BU202_08115 [Streptococcus cuniculi]QBX23140.1 hypothetical protein Javan116_0011 [Streptococcus phage Javan116]